MNYFIHIYKVPLENNSHDKIFLYICFLVGGGGGGGIMQCVWMTGLDG